MDKDILKYFMRDFCFFSPINLNGIGGVVFKKKVDNERIIIQLGLKDKQSMRTSQFTGGKTEWQEPPDGYSRIAYRLIDPRRDQYEIGIFVDTGGKTEWQELPDGYCFFEYINLEERIIGMAFKKRIDDNSKFVIYLNPENEEQTIYGQVSC